VRTEGIQEGKGRLQGVDLLWILVWDYRTFHSALILSYHFALRQVNRPPAYRKPSEHSRDSLSHPSGPTYK